VIGRIVDGFRRAGQAYWVSPRPVDRYFTTSDICTLTAMLVKFGSSPVIRSA
jgi:hypothetical protein